MLIPLSGLLGRESLTYDIFHILSQSMQAIRSFSNIRVPKPFGVPGRVEIKYDNNTYINTLRMGSFKLFKRPFPGFLTILTL